MHFVEIIHSPKYRLVNGVVVFFDTLERFYYITILNIA